MESYIYFLLLKWNHDFLYIQQFLEWIPTFDLYPTVPWMESYITLNKTVPWIDSYIWFISNSSLNGILHYFKSNSSLNGFLHLLYIQQFLEWITTFALYPTVPWKKSYIFFVSNSSLNGFLHYFKSNSSLNKILDFL